MQRGMKLAEIKAVKRLGVYNRSREGLERGLSIRLSVVCSYASVVFVVNVF